MIGRPGFATPDLSSLVRHAASDLAGQPNLQIEGAHPAAGNWIFAPPGFRPPFNLRIVFNAKTSGNVIVFAEGAMPFGTIKLAGQDALLVFGGDMRFPSHFDVNINGRDNTFFWGRYGSSNGLHANIEGPGCGVVIGEDCMVAKGASIYTSDVHPVIDMDTSEWFNPPGDVVVEPHVWLGMEALILKKTAIGFGAIVGARSLVTRDVPRRALVSGSPAKVRRTNVSWLRPGVPNPRLIEELKATEAAFLAGHAESS
ncbi:acyltransferase [Paracraurococcus lichenis]|uniref:Acyltransferase n=1 Tax=Paracraurococcus lichenis TaxID=3064888 RepID=A0ABT9E5Q9_9PROT|nr:acyltransferase [Paracraurococcus sp. LOR1-02]MDO9711508.1 acyltransferase [Paracraurococcus sp. LOR1-02]